MARLRILSDDDFDKLYKIPKLNNEERQFVFELDEIDKNYLNTINSIPVKINYILNLFLGIFPAACGVIWRNEQIYT